MLREDQQELVVDTNRLINAFSEGIANFEVFRGIPAAHPFVLQIGVQSFDKVLIFGRVANKTGVIVNRFSGKRTHVLNEALRCACASYEGLWNVALREIEAVDAQWRRSTVSNGFQSVDLAEITIPKGGRV